MDGFGLNPERSDLQWFHQPPNALFDIDIIPMNLAKMLGLALKMA